MLSSPPFGVGASMNFFAELKRRHIYRVGAAYAVFAWVLLQLVANVAPILDLPPWIARAVLLLLAIGFPLALILALIRRPPSVRGSQTPSEVCVLAVILLAVI